jgi:hypothetical protein
MPITFAYLLMVLTFYPFGRSGPPEEHASYIPKRTWDVCERDREAIVKAGIEKRAFPEGAAGLYMECTRDNPFSGRREQSSDRLTR